MIFKSSALLVWTALVLTACSGGPAPESTPDDAGPVDAEGGGTDEPVWINGSFLTCDWNRVVSTTKAQVQCVLEDRDLAGFNKNTLTIAWVVRDRDGREAKTVALEAGPLGSFDAVITMVAGLISGKHVEAELNDGTTSRRVKASFDDLEGMGSDGILTTCFASGKMSVKDCFDAAGVLVDLNEAVTKKTNHTSVDCSPGGTAHDDPNILCSLKSDAAMGGLGTTWQWFNKQDHLVADDGTLRAADFCDASGIKPQHILAPIDRQVRTYDYWEKGSMPCYDTIRSTYSQSQHYHPQVAADPAHGVDGEPFCFFVIIKDPLLIDGYGIHRLHILKNPALFPDAASDKGLTLARLKKTAEHFSCEKVDFAD